MLIRHALGTFAVLGFALYTAFTPKGEAKAARATVPARAPLAVAPAPEPHGAELWFVRIYPDPGEMFLGAMATEEACSLVASTLIVDRAATLPNGTVSAFECRVGR